MPEENALLIAQVVELVAFIITCMSMLMKLTLGYLKILHTSSPDTNHIIIVPQG